jgi:hypothetical protein
VQECADAEGKSRYRTSERACNIQSLNWKKNKKKKEEDDDDDEKKNKRKRK